MLYIGLDVHWKVSVISVLDSNGKELYCRTIHGTWHILQEELKKVKEPFEICFEASTGYGVIYDMLKALAKRVVVAHPGHLRLIFRSKKKTDRVDAQKLAKLLFLREVPPVYVPSIDIRGWRSLIEHRNNLIVERTRSKNGVRACLKANGIVPPKSLWWASGMAWLEKLELATPMETIRKEDLLMRIKLNTTAIKRVEKELKKIADAHPGVHLLMGIPGVGIRTAEAMAAYVDDPQRFSKSRKIGSYFGLTPSIDQSAGQSRIGRITRTGPSTMRRLLTEAAWQAIRCNPIMKERYKKIRRGDKNRTKIAIIAVAHYLARIMLAMLKNNQEWNPGMAA
jgi:transposase